MVTQELVSTIDASFARLQGASGQDMNHGHSHLLAFGGNDTRGPRDTATAVLAHDSPHQDFESETFLVQAVSPTIGRGSGGRTPGMDADGAGNGLIPVAFDCKAGGDTALSMGDIPGTLRGEGHGGGHAAAMVGMSVRRLTPLECERLQGFPDNYTRIPYRGKPAEECPDGPRYKAIGNSMAERCMNWLGRRIELVESVMEELKRA